MCGISGIYTGQKIDKKEIVTKMLNSISHRGPDEKLCIHENENLAIGMNRLSIIDIKNGSQPQTTSDKRYTVVFNGEIYNFKDIKKKYSKKTEFKTNSDTEVILKGYALVGEKIFEELNGIFAIAIWDNAIKKLIITRDPFGVKPLFFLKQSNSFYFSSELKSFTLNKISNQINLLSLGQYLHSGYVFHPQTALQNVEQLKPGEIISIDDKINIKKIKRLEIPYFKKDQQFETNEKFLLEKTKNEISDSISRQMVSDVPIGLLLSSGTDSLTILTYLKKLGLSESLSTFSIYYDNENFNEIDEIKKITSKWGIKNYSLQLSSKDLWNNFDNLFLTYDNLEFIPTCFPAYMVSKLASSHVKVAHAGIGGDEIFGGYPTYRATMLHEKIKNFKFILNIFRPFLKNLKAGNKYLDLNEKIRRFFNGLKFDLIESNFAWRGIFDLSEIKGLTNNINLFDPQTIYLKKFYKNKLDSSMLGWADLNTWQVDHSLPLWDKAGMASSLEVRVPFLDHKLLNFLMKIPSKIRMQNLGSKKFLKKILKSEMGEDFQNVPKKGFQVPIHSWLHESNKNLIGDYLFSLPKELFPKIFLDKIFNDFIKNKGESTLKVWMLICLAGYINKHSIKL